MAIVVVTPFVVLFFVALRALYVGYGSFEPVLAAELYVDAFCFVVFGIPTFMRTIRYVEPWQSGVLLLLCVAGAVLFGRFAPRIGERNYCGAGDIDWRDSGMWPHRPSVPPHVYRCTRLPFEIVGFFAVWWLGAWAFKWWNERSEGTAP